MLTINDLKQAARAMRAAGEAATHSAALEAVAQKNGYRDWNTAAALAPKVPVVWQTRWDIEPTLLALKAQYEPIKDRVDPGDEFFAAMDAFMGRLLEVEDVGLAVATMRYAISKNGLHLPAHMNRMSNFVRFAERYRTVVMGDVDMSYWEREHYPEMVPPGAEPIAYLDLVEEVKKRLSRNPTPNLRNLLKSTAKLGANPDTVKEIYHLRMQGMTAVIAALSGATPPEPVEAAFNRTLVVEGPGYRAGVVDGVLVLDVGMSHPVRFPIPETVIVTCLKPTEIRVQGAFDQQVGQIAGEIRALRKPNAYTGYGIRYQGEAVQRKPVRK